ncbi:MAG TPA: TetR family transcriptional regulator C-terminal domain-containing protein [Aestuariivirgaceae bacterium]|jgi:TetR/AcrR family transcriptional regulator
MTALKKPKSRIGEVNVERILDAGLAVFARHGYSGARIDQIAETADMSKPNLLYYFRTKEELYRAVLTRTLDMWLKPLRELDPARSPREALGHYIDQKLAYSRGHPAASRLFAIEIMQGAPHLSRVLSTELASLIETKKATIRKWIAEGRLANIDPYHLLFAIWAATQHYADFDAQIQTLTGKTLADDEFFEATKLAVKRIILDGLVLR